MLIPSAMWTEGQSRARDPNLEGRGGYAFPLDCLITRMLYTKCPERTVGEYGLQFAIHPT